MGTTERKGKSITMLLHKLYNEIGGYMRKGGCWKSEKKREKIKYRNWGFENEACWIIQFIYLFSMAEDDDGRTYKRRLWEREAYSFIDLSRDEPRLFDFLGMIT